MFRFTIAHNSDMNVTPFVDVMLVLLIIFMVSLPAATLNFKIDLPPPGTPQTPAPPPTIVTLRADGGLFIGERATSLGALPVDVAAVLGGPRPTDQRVYLRGERGVRYGALMRVINRLKASGYDHVALVSEEL